jgi:hypothetical protein
LNEDWLKPVFAEAKITTGAPDPERWASLLSPAAYQALRDRVDVEFPPNSPVVLPPAEEVSLDEVDQHVGVLDRDFHVQFRR